MAVGVVRLIASGAHRIGVTVKKPNAPAVKREAEEDGVRHVTSKTASGRSLAVSTKLQARRFPPSRKSDSVTRRFPPPAAEPYSSSIVQT